MQTSQQQQYEQQQKQQQSNRIPVVLARSRIENKVERVRLAGGLIGLLGTSPLKALNAKLLEVNSQGWKVVHIIEDDTGNLLVWLLRTVLLIATLGIWTPRNGYFLILERDR